MDQIRNKLGFAFFLFAGVIALLSFLQEPMLLLGLRVVHYFTLAVIFMLRRPGKHYDRIGLILGLIALFLPLSSQTPQLGLPATILGTAGYSLTLWSLFSLGKSFGIAPADRGLVQSGPYKLVRHPMYLGEIIMHAGILWSSSFWGVFLWVLLVVIQVLRIGREERAIEGYAAYAGHVSKKLLPGVW